MNSINVAMAAVININGTQGGNSTIFNTTGGKTTPYALKSTIDVLLTLLYVSSVILHTLGSYLQIRLYKEGKDSVQLVYLINLALTEAIGCTLGLFALHIPKLMSISPRTNPVYGEFHKYVSVVLYTLPLIYYTNYIYITVDKLLYIILGIKYHVYCTINRTLKLIKATWSVGGCVWIIMSLVSYIREARYDDYFSQYFNPTLDFVFLATGVVCYTMIFKEYKNTRAAPVPLSYVNENNTTARRKKESSIKLFLNSRFYVSGLLIATFLVLVVIPDLVYLFHTVIGKHGSILFNDIVLVFFLLSYLNDALIYIFMQPEVRRLLRNMLFQ